MSNHSLTATIAQLDPLEGELLTGDDSIEVSIATRPSDLCGPGKKSFRTTLNSVLAIYGKRRDNPNQVTAAQVGAYTIEEVTALLKDKLGVEGIAVNSLKLEGSTKAEIIAEARAGTVHNADNLGGKPACAYVLNANLDQAWQKLACQIDEMTADISDTPRCRP